MTATTLTTPPPARRLPAWAALLGYFYARTGLPLPRVERLRDDEVPQPYKGLLVHSSDMTPTLESYYRQSPGITVLSRQIIGDLYFREVVLHVANGARPIEYGVISIHLDHFPETARRLILAEQSPLGSILQSEGIGHISWPQAFFRVESDSRMSAVLHLGQPCVLFGRRNVLLDGARRLLAEVIEVLAPVENHPPLSADHLL
jgi:chorismate-pyruvate lyase